MNDTHATCFPRIVKWHTMAESNAMRRIGGVAMLQNDAKPHEC